MINEHNNGKDTVPKLGRATFRDLNDRLGRVIDGIERTMAKTLEYYLALPYTIVLRRDIKDENVVARVEELPDVQPTGITETGGASNLRDNMQAWIEDA